MTPTDYLEQSAHTVSTSFHPELVSESLMHDITTSMGIDMEDLDDVKKALFYGRKMKFNVVHSHWNPPISSDDPNTLHAVLGMLTEAWELMELVDLDDVPQEKWIDEVGDILWYVALLLRTKGLTFEQVMSANIRKLKARFPEKFDESLAVNRDEEAEMLALKG